MPSLQKNGKIRLSGAEQVAVIIVRSGFKRAGVKETSLPKYMREFQKKHGGYFKWNGYSVKFVITNRAKFLAQLRIKNHIAEKRKAIRELKDDLRDVANYEALLFSQMRGKGLKSTVKAQVERGI